MRSRRYSGAEGRKDRLAAEADGLSRASASPAYPLRVDTTADARGTRYLPTRAGALAPAPTGMFVPPRGKVCHRPRKGPAQSGRPGLMATH